MAKLHVAAGVLVALALLSTVTASGSGTATTAMILAAAKGTAVLRYFLGLDRATLGWRIVLVGFVVLTCAAAGTLHAIGLHLSS